MKKISLYYHGSVVPIIFAFLSMLMLVSCEKLIDNNPSATQLLDKEVFTDSATVKSAIAGMYSQLSYGQVYPVDHSIYPALSADELQFVGNTYDAYINNALLPDQNELGTLWSTPYASIYQANSLIEGLANSSNMTEVFKIRSAAEARFVRAFCHFYLLNIFGDVPLVTSTDVEANKLSPRTSTTTVYEQITNDLLFAQANLPADYSVSGGARVRANKWVATALLARVYLYMKNWSAAETQSGMLLENKDLFSLQTDLGTVFSPDSKEAIWQFYNDVNGYTRYAGDVLPNPTQGVPKFVFTDALKNAFEQGDLRKTQWTATIGYLGTTYTYPSKYKSLISGANAEYFTVFRLAEQYLIRAEARAQLNNTDGARQDLFAVRNRAQLGETPARDKDALLLAIEKERQVELNCEWGHRWFDLKRSDRINAVLGSLKTDWKPEAALYPIPQQQRTYNANLTQNPGYN